MTGERIASVKQRNGRPCQFPVDAREASPARIVCYPKLAQQRLGVGRGPSLAAQSGDQVLLPRKVLLALGNAPHRPFTLFQEQRAIHWPSL